MTRLGVLRWASRAFACPLQVEMFRDYEGRAAVEMKLPVYARRISYTYLWSTGANWGRCVRAIERSLLLDHDRRLEPGWIFKAQLLVHEEKEELVAGVLGGDWMIALSFKDPVQTPRLRVELVEKTRRKLRASLRPV